jgi:hypothetical protein
VVDQCVDAILRLQESGEGPDTEQPPSQWPYVGVYKVGAATPAPYRIGGTAIATMALASRRGSRPIRRCATRWAAASTSCATRGGTRRCRRPTTTAARHQRLGHIEGLTCLSRLSRSPSHRRRPARGGDGGGTPRPRGGRGASRCPRPEGGTTRGPRDATRWDRRRRS